MEEKKEITFQVYRFNPQVDAKPFYDRFKISVEKGITVLRALNYIKENLEPKLTYRAFCQAGICGSCAMKINGVSKLACTTQVFDELGTGPEENVIIIEPLANLDVIRDMVVNMDPVVEKMRHYKTWVESTMDAKEMGKKEFNISEKEFKLYDKATDCILCASCVSECTITGADRNFIGPLIMMKSYRMNVDSRDGITGQRLAKLVQDHGIWDCTHCYRCQEACVKSIPILDGIHGNREMAIRERGPKDTEGSRHGYLFVDDIKSKGRLVEMTLPLRTLGLFKFALMSLKPGPLAMVLKGRVPPPPFLMKSIPGIKRVRKMMKDFDEYQKQSRKGG